MGFDPETAANAEAIASPDAPPAVPDAQAEIQAVLLNIERDIDQRQGDRQDIQEEIDKLDGDYRVIETIAEKIADWETGTAAEMRHDRDVAQIESRSWRAEATTAKDRAKAMEDLAIKRGMAGTQFRKDIARLEEEKLQAIRKTLPEESDRQMIILALAELSLRRPGWEDTTRRIATTLYGDEMFDGFRETSEGQIDPIPLPQKDRLRIADDAITRQQAEAAVQILRTHLLGTCNVINDVAADMERHVVGIPLSEDAPFLAEQAQRLKRTAGLNRPATLEDEMTDCPACEAWSTWPKRGDRPCPLCRGSRKVPTDTIREEP